MMLMYHEVKQTYSNTNVISCYGSHMSVTIVEKIKIVKLIIILLSVLRSKQSLCQFLVVQGTRYHPPV